MIFLSAVRTLLSVAGPAAALCAAYHWFRASTIDIDPGWRTAYPKSEADARKSIEPVEPELSQRIWTASIIRAAAQSAALNRTAARWTAAATVLSAASSILHSLPRRF